MAIYWRIEGLEVADSGSTAVPAQGGLVATLLTIKCSDQNPHRGLRAARQPVVAMPGAVIHRGATSAAGSVRRTLQELLMTACGHGVT